MPTSIGGDAEGQPASCARETGGDLSLSNADIQERWRTPFKTSRPWIPTIRHKLPTIDTRPPPLGSRATPSRTLADLAQASETFRAATRTARATSRAPSQMEAAPQAPSNEPRRLEHSAVDDILKEGFAQQGCRSAEATASPLASARRRPQAAPKAHPCPRARFQPPRNIPGAYRVEGASSHRWGLHQGQRAQRLQEDQCHAGHPWRHGRQQAQPHCDQRVTNHFDPNTAGLTDTRSTCRRQRLRRTTSTGRRPKFERRPTKSGGARREALAKTNLLAAKAGGQEPRVGKASMTLKLIWTAVLRIAAAAPLAGGRRGILGMMRSQGCGGDSR